MQTDSAREQMVEQQVRAWHVLDERILDTLRAVPRERFVPPAWRGLAYADSDIPLPAGKRMLRPMVVGRILAAVALRGGESVLEIGTGSGYVSACMAALGGRVRSLELHAELATLARANLAASGAVGVDVVEGDGVALADESRYDAIVVTASLPIYQTQFERALRPGGRLFVVVGTGPLQEANLVRRLAEREWQTQTLFETRIEALEHAPRPPVFGF